MPKMGKWGILGPKIIVELLRKYVHMFISIVLVFEEKIFLRLKREKRVILGPKIITFQLFPKSNH